MAINENLNITNQTITIQPTFFNCWSNYSTLVTCLLLYGVFATFIIITLIWILKNNFKKSNQEVKA
jgi:hypothetical protein